jgi:very-short-patch-repair endonuclease
LKELFPYDTIYEEVTLPGSNKPSRPSKLFADFFVPAYKLIVEVHGRQHFEYVSFFHKTKAEFLKSKSRDRDKKRWCEINSLNFVSLKFSENLDEWKQRILEEL